MHKFLEDTMAKHGDLKAKFLEDGKALAEAQRKMEASLGKEMRVPYPGECRPYVPLGPPSIPSFDIAVELRETATLPVEPHGNLIFQPGTLLFRLGLEKEIKNPKMVGKDDLEPVLVACSVTDAEGSSWRADTCMESCRLIGDLEDLFDASTFTDPQVRASKIKRLDSHHDLINELETPVAEPGHVRFWNDVPTARIPTAWRSAMKERRVLSDVWSFLDFRQRLELSVGDLDLMLFPKHACPSIDCALLRGDADLSSRLLVMRCSNLSYEWGIDGDGRKFGLDSMGSYGVAPVTFAFLLDAAKLLPFASPGDHYRSLETWKVDGLNRPGLGPVFHATERLDHAPQPNVRFTPREVA